MVDGAYNWLSPHLDNEGAAPNLVSWLNNEDTFWTEVNKQFSVADKTELYRIKYKALKQTSSVQDLLKDFKTFFNLPGYSE